MRTLVPWNSCFYEVEIWLQTSPPLMHRPHCRKIHWNSIKYRANTNIKNTLHKGNIQKALNSNRITICLQAAKITLWTEHSHRLFLLLWYKMLNQTGSSWTKYVLSHVYCKPQKPFCHFDMKHTIKCRQQ